MDKLLLVVDMQVDFIEGSLGTAEAQAIVPNVVKKIKEWDGAIVVTKDTHHRNYLNTREGRYLPVEHCILCTPGHRIDGRISKALRRRARRLGIDSDVYPKESFGSIELVNDIYDDIRDQMTPLEHVEIVGLCTDICVVSNALILRSAFPEADITVDASCCAGTTPENHQAALKVMKSCHINIINE